MKFLLTFLFLLFFKITLSQDYFERYGPLSDSLENIYGIPSSVMMAIAYHESAGGKSKVAKHSNNHFGIKGKNHKVKSAFKYFESDTASYVGFCNLITNKKFYKTLKGNSDVKKWTRAISKSGYASNSGTWEGKILGIIRKYKLQ